MKTRKEERPDTMGTEDRLERLIRELLVEIGEDPGREGLASTPRRVAETWRFFTQGYSQDIGELLGGAIVEDSHQAFRVKRYA